MEVNLGFNFTVSTAVYYSVPRDSLLCEKKLCMPRSKNLSVPRDALVCEKKLRMPRSKNLSTPQLISLTRSHRAAQTHSFSLLCEFLSVIVAIILEKPEKVGDGNGRLI